MLVIYKGKILYQVCLKVELMLMPVPVSMSVITWKLINNKLKSNMGDN